MDDLPEKKQSTDQGPTIDIFTVLGHDLKSPLNAVESYLEILRNKVLGDGLDPYMQILENSITRLHQMRELITDVVDWSKIQQPSSFRPLTILDRPSPNPTKWGKSQAGRQSETAASSKPDTIKPGALSKETPAPLPATVVSIMLAGQR